jgi:ubiquinone/menaquinone biosynthesis C-methylase UbiE
VRHVIGLDPSPKLLAMARRAERPRSARVEFIEGSSETIPLEGASVDTVVDHLDVVRSSVGQ